MNGSDSNDGSQATPFATMLPVADKLSFSEYLHPVEIYCSDGTYTDQPEITYFSGRLTIYGNTTTPANVQFNGGFRVGRSLDAVIILRGIGLYGPAKSTTTYCLYVWEVGFFELRNCDIHPTGWVHGGWIEGTNFVSQATTITSNWYGLNFNRSVGKLASTAFTVTASTNNSYGVRSDASSVYLAPDTTITNDVNPARIYNLANGGQVWYAGIDINKAVMFDQTDSFSAGDRIVMEKQSDGTFTWVKIN